MATHPWNESYASGELPWDTGTPEPELVAFVQAGAVVPGRALEIGAGRGTNARWLAEQGFDVLGVDIAPLAVEQARARTTGAIAARCRFEVHDVLADPPAGPFAFVFDRGCFHVFDDAADRARFAANVARVLAPGGLWLSLLGSTEGPARDEGPPRRTAHDVIEAIEPVLAIQELTAMSFDGTSPPAAAWRCVARKRTIPAQPSTGR
ncbi:MAG TPA: class I SAM-dependent methyltransferase [Vicinamibacterales bacterium]|jgi:SAM-dependent methyltransferase|nr:class I SAM-dependent methyltransferase [Vicinamibacterales bacterium]